MNKLIKTFSPHYVKVHGFNSVTTVKHHLRYTVLPYIVITLILIAFGVLSPM